MAKIKIYTGDSANFTSQSVASGDVGKTYMGQSMNLQKFEMVDVTTSANEKTFMFETPSDKLLGAPTKVYFSVTQLPNVYNNKEAKSYSNQLPNVRGQKVRISFQTLAGTYDAGEGGTGTFEDTDTLNTVPIWGGIDLAIPAGCKQIDETVIIDLVSRLAGLALSPLSSSGFAPLEEQDCAKNPIYSMLTTGKPAKIV